MKTKLHLNSSQIVYLFGGVMLIGFIVSAILTKDLRWMNWHFSRLGEGGTFSANLFNSALIISAFTILTLALTTSKDILKITDVPKVIVNRANKIISLSLIVVSICLFSVAIFPFDKYPIIHNTFGYLMLATFIVLCLNTKKILSIFTRRFYTYCDNVLLFTVICYTLFVVFRLISLLMVELAVFTYLYIWLIRFISGIRETN